MSQYSLNPIIHTISNPAGMKVTVMDWGATLLSIKIPVPGEKEPREVLLGVKDPEKWSTQSCYFNATIGRYANRIAHSSFDVNGKHYVLSSNDKHCLHGGIDGFDKRRFTFIDVGENSLTLQLHSPDGDMGFPGNYDLTVTYTLNDDNSLSVHYLGKCDAQCPSCITNHAYFNLNGYNSSILNHTVEIKSDKILVLDEDSIPTGEVRDIKDSAFDFNTAKKVGLDFMNDAQMIPSRGYDHPYLIDSDLSTPFAKVTSDDGKLTLSVSSDYPATQFYTGNYVHAGDPIIARDDGKEYPNQAGLCLEPEYYPDAPHLPQFAAKNPLVGPDAPLSRTICYKFTTN